MASSRVSTCLLLLIGLLVASFAQAAQDGHRMARSELPHAILSLQGLIRGRRHRQSSCP